MDGDSLGCIEFGSKTSRDFQRNVQYPFFSHYLKDQGDWRDDAAEAIVFETGSNVWKTYDAWPPPAATPTGLYFHPNGRLSFEPPAGRSAGRPTRTTNTSAIRTSPFPSRRRFARPRATCG